VTVGRAGNLFPPAYSGARTRRRLAALPQRAEEDPTLLLQADAGAKVLRAREFAPPGKLGPGERARGGAGAARSPRVVAGSKVGDVDSEAHCCCEIEQGQRPAKRPQAMLSPAAARTAWRGLGWREGRAAGACALPRGLGCFPGRQSARAAPPPASSTAPSICRCRGARRIGNSRRRLSPTHGCDTAFATHILEQDTDIPRHFRKPAPAKAGVLLIGPRQGSKPGSLHASANTNDPNGSPGPARPYCGG